MPRFSWIKTSALTLALAACGGVNTAQAQDWTNYLHWPYVPPQVPGNGFEYNGLYDGWYRYPREQRIVPQELWDRVRLRIAEISKRFTGRQMRGMNRTERSRTYLFSGLLVCGLCGANMVITGGTKDNAKYACPLQRYRVFVQINCSFDGTVLKTNS